MDDFFNFNMDKNELRKKIYGFIKANPDIKKMVKTRMEFIKRVETTNPKLSQTFINDLMEDLTKQIFDRELAQFDAFFFCKMLDNAFVGDYAKLYISFNYICDLNSGKCSGIVDRIFPKPPEEENFL